MLECLRRKILTRCKLGFGISPGGRVEGIPAARLPGAARGGAGTLHGWELGRGSRGHQAPFEHAKAEVQPASLLLFMFPAIGSSEAGARPWSAESFV